MSDGFEVVFDDLTGMADTFATEAGRYRGIIPTLIPPIADSGDGVLNSMMRTVTDMLAALHKQMAQTISNHHDKLTAARDSYQRRDIDNRFLFDDLMRGIE